jgi:hypothetical protein
MAFRISIKAVGALIEEKDEEGFSGKNYSLMVE